LTNINAINYENLDTGTTTGTRDWGCRTPKRGSGSFHQLNLTTAIVYS